MFEMIGKILKAPYKYCFNRNNKNAKVYIITFVNSSGRIKYESFMLNMKIVSWKYSIKEI